MKGRKAHLLGLLSACALVGLSACGGDDQEQGRTAEESRGETVVRGRAFDTEIPGAWRIENRPATRSAVIGSWTRRIDPDSTLVITVTGKSRVSAERAVSRLRDTVSQRLDFEEIAFDRTEVGRQLDATRFAFRLGDTQKVVFVFDACGNKTVTLIGTAPAAKFDRVEESFQAAADAFDPNCGGELEPPANAEAVQRALVILATSRAGAAEAGAAGREGDTAGDTGTEPGQTQEETETDPTEDLEEELLDGEEGAEEEGAEDEDLEELADEDEELFADEAADEAAEELGVDESGDQFDENEIESTEPPLEQEEPADEGEGGSQEGQ